MEKIKFTELESGQRIKKGELVFIVEEVMLEENRALIMNLETKEEKTLSGTTIVRWYTYADAADTEAAAPAALQEEVVAAPIKAVAGPKFKKAAKVAETQDIAPEAAPEIEAVYDEEILAHAAALEEAAAVEEAPAEEEVVEAAVQEANVKAKPAKQFVPGIAQKLWDDLFAYIAEDSNLKNALQKTTLSYTGLAFVSTTGSRNFAELHPGKRSFSILVKSKALDSELLGFVNVAKPSYKWTLDARFAIKSEEDLEVAKKLIQASFIHTVAEKAAPAADKKAK